MKRLLAVAAAMCGLVPATAHRDFGKRSMRVYRRELRELGPC